MSGNTKRVEETLDPEDWKSFRKLGHSVLDDMMDYLETIREKKHTFATEEQKAAIYKPLSVSGVGEEKAYEEFRENILPSLVGPKIPKWWGWVVGSGTAYGMLTNIITGAMNIPSDDSFSAAFDVNRQALNWIKEMLGYPLDASGVFVTGGSEANFTGLAVARNAKAEVDMKTTGMQGVPRKMTIYVSEEGHHCLERSVELLGFGKDALRWIPTDDNYRVRLDLLKASIKDDRQKGLKPICLIGNAGTVNTGAFDDFISLDDIAKKEDMWLHVDGAFGAWVKISQSHRHLADGLERADSIAFDLHKWMSMPYGLGCTLTRHPREHLSTFMYGEEAAYLRYTLDKPIDELLGTSLNMSLRLSNEILGLKAYLLLRAYGADRFARVVQKNLDDINYLAEKICTEPDFELAAPVMSNIVVFRFKPKNLSDKQIDDLNRQIFQTSLSCNPGMVSDSTIKGRYTLRACNVNQRTNRDDFDWLISEVRRLGEELLDNNKYN